MALVVTVSGGELKKLSGDYLPDVDFCGIKEVGVNRSLPGQFFYLLEEDMGTFPENTDVGIILGEEIVYPNPHFPVISRRIDTEDEIRDQLIWDRRGKAFAVAVVTDESGRYVLVRERKYGKKRQLISAPTGGLKRNETPLKAGIREFTKETGYEACEWRFLTESSQCDFADKIDGGEHFYCHAVRAYKTGEPRGPHQTVVLATAAEVITMIAEGKIPAMSAAALLLDIALLARG